MANEIFMADHFAVEIVSAGGFLDDDPGFCGKAYNVQTYTIRLNHIALEAWRAATATDDREDDETWAAWHPGEDRSAYRAAAKQRRAEFDAQIAAALQITGADTGTILIAEVLSEIFAVVYIPAAS